MKRSWKNFNFDRVNDSRPADSFILHDRKIRLLNCKEENTRPKNNTNEPKIKLNVTELANCQGTFLG